MVKPELSMDQSTRWLLAHFGQYPSVSDYFDGEFFTPIKNFALVWNLYEKHIEELQSNNPANRSFIRMDEILWNVEECGPSNSVIEITFDYYRNRYFDGEGARENFASLWPKGKSEQYRKKIGLALKEDASLGEKSRACRMITMWLRHNLIHGVKDVATLKDQAELFNIALFFLENTIDFQNDMNESYKESVKIKEEASTFKIISSKVINDGNQTVAKSLDIAD